MYHFCFHVHCRYIKNTKLAAICNTATSIWSLHTPAQHVKHALVHSWANNVYTTHGNAFSLKGIKLTCTYLTYFKIRLKGTTLPHADCLLTSVCITTCACSRGHLSHDFTRSQCRKDAFFTPTEPMYKAEIHMWCLSLLSSFCLEWCLSYAEVNFNFGLHGWKLTKVCILV